MKSIALLGFAFAMSPVLAAAQQSPPPDAAASFPHPSFAAMQQMHGQMEQIHKQARAQILGSLTPAHRTMLASVVGNLAISANPDRAAAARTIDASLSQSESRSILATEAAARDQEHALMTTARTQFEASLTAEQRTAMQQRMVAHQAERPDGAMRQHTPDAGMTLLDVAIGGEHHGFGLGGPPMGARPPQ